MFLSLLSFSYKQAVYTDAINLQINSFVLQDMCSPTLNGSITVSMVGWCSQCQQHEVLLDATSHAMLADAAAPQIKYRQVCCAYHALWISLWVHIVSGWEIDLALYVPASPLWMLHPCDLSAVHTRTAFSMSAFHATALTPCAPWYMSPS